MSERMEKNLAAAELEPDPVRARFEEQYAHPRVVKRPLGDDLIVYDLSPERPRQETPILFAPGITPDPENHKESSYVWYKDGRRVLFPDAGHGIDTEKVKGLWHAEVRKAAALLATLDAENVAKTDAVAHSEGALNIAIAAAMEPQRFRNIVLVEPAGMSGERNPIIMALAGLAEDKAVQKEWEEGRSEVHMYGRPDKVRYYQRETLLQTLKESIASSRMTINDLLVYLKGEGIHISIVHGVEDKFFPMEDVQRMADLNQIDGFYSVQGAHQRMFTEPSKYAKLAEEALNALEKAFPNRIEDAEKKTT